MRKALFFLSVISLILVACGPKINSQQQEQLEKLTAKVDSITEKVNALDSAALMQLADDFFERKNFIQKKITDTLPAQMVFRLDSFINLRKPLGFIRGEYGTIKTEANIMQQQLVDLNHDVDARLIEEKQFKKYYDLEFKNYGELRLASEQLFRAIEHSKARYQLMIPKIEEFLSDYKATMNE